MNFKEKLEELKVKITNFNRNYEFEAELEDHEIGNQNVYRLHYIDYHRIGEHYGKTSNKVGVIDWPFEPFMFPQNMRREERFKVFLI